MGDLRPDPPVSGLGAGKRGSRFGAGVLAGVTGTVVLFAAVLGIRSFLTETIPGIGLGSSGTSAEAWRKNWMLLIT